MWPKGDCPNCGASDDARALVTYEPAPNNAQEEMDFSDELAKLSTLTCTECGCPIGAISLGDHDQDSGSDYKIDEDLR